MVRASDSNWVPCEGCGKSIRHPRFFCNGCAKEQFPDGMTVTYSREPRQRKDDR